MIKPLVIFHSSCADGFGAAFAAWLKLGESDSIEEGAEYVPMQYGTVPDIESWHMQYAISQREVYILDFSFPRQTMDYLFSVARRVTWLDHHRTSFEMWCEDGERSLCEQSNGRDEVILDNNKSGAMLAWEYFHPGTEIPMLIKHIDDYDRWVFALKGTKEINKALWSFTPWSFPIWQEIIDDDNYGSMWSQGSAILRAHDQNVQSVVKGGARKCCIEVHVEGEDVRKALEVFAINPDVRIDGLAANCPPHLTSDVGHELATQSGTFGLLWHIDKDLRCRCSLRSNGDYDVSAIAKAFGGGGHRNAAGFEVDIQTLLGWLK